MILSPQGLKPWGTLRNSWCRTQLSLSRLPREEQVTVTLPAAYKLSPRYTMQPHFFTLICWTQTYALLFQHKGGLLSLSQHMVQSTHQLTLASLPWNTEVLTGEQLRWLSQAMGTQGPRISVEASAVQCKTLSFVIRKGGRHFILWNVVKGAICTLFRCVFKDKRRSPFQKAQTYLTIAVAARLSNCCTLQVVLILHH